MAVSMPVTMPETQVMADPRFNSVAPIGTQSLATALPAPVGNVGGQRAVPLLRAQGEGGSDSRVAPNPNPQSLDGLSWSDALGAINSGLSSPLGRGLTYAMALSNPALGAGLLAARWLTNPSTFGGGDKRASSKPGQDHSLTLDHTPDFSGQGNGGNANGGNSSDHSGFGGSSFNDHSLGGMSFNDHSDVGHDLNTHDFNDSGGGFSFAKGGPVPGKGPHAATVHGGEFVMTRDAVKGAGGGSMKRGRQHLANLMKAMAAKGRSRS